MVKLIKKYWLFLLIVLQPILDIVAYFQYDSKIGTMAGYIRLVFMVLIVFYALYKTPKKKSLFLLMAVVGVYCILHVINGFRVGYGSLVQDVSYMAKVLQAPVLGIAFCYLINEEDQKQQVVNGLVVNFFVILATTLIAHMTGTGDYTYKIYNVGMMGWFANANAQSIIIVTLVPFVLYWILGKRNAVLSVVIPLSTVFLLIANGTKAAYLSVFIIFGGFIAFYLMKILFKKQESKKEYISLIVFFAIIVIGSFAVYPMTPRHTVDVTANGVRDEENKDIDEKKSEITGNLTLEEILKDPQKKKELIEFYEPELSPILVEKFGAEAVLKEYGWAPDSYTLADVRLQKRMCAKLLWEKEDFLTRLVGMEFTQMKEFDLENDYSAIYYYYGYLGMGLYIVFLAYFAILMVVTLLKNWKESFTIFNFVLFIVYVLQIGLAQFSGAILRRPNASIYLALVAALIFYQCKKINAPIDKRD